MPLNKRLCCFILIGFLQFNLNAQYLDVPGQYNQRYYSLNEYSSGAQIWNATQCENGDMIFGSSTDIVCYNGYEWKLIQPKKSDKEKYETDVASAKVGKVYKAKNGTVYIGRKENFGYIAYDSKGEPYYQPLFVNTTEDNIGTIWNIFESDKGTIYFFSSVGLFKYSNKTVKNIGLPKAFNGYSGNTVTQIENYLVAVYEESNSTKTKYLAIDLKKEYGDQQIGKEIFLPKDIVLNNIRGSFQIDDKSYILDVDSDLFEVFKAGDHFNWSKVDEGKFTSLKSYTPNVIRRVKDYILLATENNGLIITNLKGEIIRTIDQNSNLEVNYVNDFFFDSANNLWLCLDNGIQYYETSYPLTSFTKKEGITSLIEAIDFTHKPSLYALHTGICNEDISEGFSKFVPSTNKQSLIFDLKTFNTTYGKKTLYVGNDSIYAFDYKTKKTTNLIGEYAYLFAQSEVNPNDIFLSLENGIGKLTAGPNNTWTYKQILTNLKGQSYSIICKGDKVYLGVKDLGVYEYNVRTGRTEIYREERAKKEDVNSTETPYYLVEFQGKVYVGTVDGIATLDKKNKLIVPDKEFSRFFVKGKNLIHRLINLNDQKLFIVNITKKQETTDFVVSWIEKEKGKWKHVKAPFFSAKFGLTASIAEDEKHNIWLGTTNGLYVLNSKALQEALSVPKIKFDRLLVNDKEVAYDLTRFGKLEDLEFEQNSLKFYFHLLEYAHSDKNEYRYKLLGFNDEWSNWSNLNYANLEKIPNGTYTLVVQGRNSFGVNSPEIQYEITILPPWYRTIWAYIFYFLLLILAVYGVVRLSLIRVRQQNIKLEETVQERTKEIAEQNQLLEHQKAEITQKSNDILDSIHYAKRIQTTILPAESRLNELFDEHFVFYRPKDIVSGDFYWAREVQDKMIFSAIDCTGHGVPGALVSIVGNNGLLRAVNEFKLTEPSAILDKLREIVINAFRSEGTLDVKDGMDIALCSIDYKTGELKFAGANNECVIIRNGEIIELKPDKQPIGLFVDAKPFTQTTFQLEPGDCIYLYTDGYVDQFGGDKGKKYKSKPFKAMISKIGHLSMKEQYQKVQLEFDTWKANVEQVDDVCVFAVKFKGIRS